MHTRTKVYVTVAIAVTIAASFLASGMLFSTRLTPAPSSVGNGIAPSTPVKIYGQNGARTFSGFFGAIRDMTIEFNFTEDGSTSSERISYISGMCVLADDSVGYRVNLTDTTPGENGADNESATVWVDLTSGNILQVSMQGQYWTGADAQKESGVLTFMTTDYWLSLLNSSTVVETQANHTVSVGSAELYATTYEGLPSFPEYQNMVITVGSIPESGMQLVLSASYTVPGSGSGSFRVLALTLNQ